MTSIEVRAADSTTWSAVHEVMGRAGGSNGCWCQYWLLGPDYRGRRDHNEGALRGQVAAGSAGLVAFLDDVPAAWARLTPRSELPWILHRFRAWDVPEDDPLTLPCFVVRRAFRGRGLMPALIAAAVDRAIEDHTALEAYPVDAAAPGATRNRFTGVLSTFVASGFRVADRLSNDRVVVRFDPH